MKIHYLPFLLFVETEKVSYRGIKINDLGEKYPNLKSKLKILLTWLD